MRFSTLCVVALCALSPACWVTSSEYDHTRTAIEARVHALEGNDQQRRQQLQEAVDQATTQVRTLNDQLEQARAQTRNLADMGTRVDGFDERLRVLNGTLEEIRHTLDTHATLVTRIDAIERRTGITPLVDASQIPADNAAAVAMARQSLEARDYARTRFVANAVIQRAAADPMADDALLLVARANLAENRAATAVQDCQRLLSTYPRGDTVPDTLSVLSEAFVNLRLCTQAQNTLRILVERHGSSPAGTAARPRLQAVRALPREACSE